MDGQLTLKGTFARMASLMLIGLALFSMVQWVSASQELGLIQKSRVIVLNVNAAIGPATQDYISRNIEQAALNKNPLIILQLDTPGGLSSSMRNIIKTILASSVPVVTYVAPSGARAASAGTYILYASSIAAMAPGTNVGAATPVAIGGESDAKAPENKDVSKQKSINDAKAYIRSLAQLRGRNVAWAEQAVGEASSLSAEEALKQQVIDLVAKDIPDLLAKIDGRKVQVNGQELIMHSKNLKPYEIRPDWRSEFLSFITDPSVAYILLMIGFYGLFFEFANPGFVLPGVAGAIALLLALYAFQLLPINYAGLALILLGMAFIFGELFMTSGVLAIGGVLSLAVGSLLLLRTADFAYGLPWELITTAVILTMLVASGILYLAWRARAQKGVSGAEGMIGKQGLVVDRNGLLWVQVEGELWHFNSTEPLQAGQKVEVIGLQGLILQVILKGE